MSGGRTGAWPGRAALVVAFAALGALALREVGSLDTGFHLRAGEHILDGQGWPRDDPFTYTLGDRPYVDTSWGYQVGIALVHRACGAAGLSVLHALLVLAIFGVVLATARLVPSRATIVAVVLLLGGVVAEMRYEARPELVSYLLLAVVLYLLHRHAEGRASPLWLLPLLHGLWANLHSLFILGWAVCVCFSWASLARGFDRRLLLWCGLSFATPFVNPYGWVGVRFPFTLATRLSADNPFQQTIGEFVSPFKLGLTEQYPFFPTTPIYGLWVFAALALWAAFDTVRAKRYHGVLLLAAFGWLAYQMIRNVPLVVVACAPFVVWGLEASWRRLRLDAARRGRVERAVAIAVILAGLGLGSRVVHDAYYVASRREDRFGVGWNRLAVPADALEYARRAALPGRMLNHLNFGGYAMWALGEPVYVDGRLEVVGESFYAHYQRVLASEDALEAEVARHGIGWVIFPYRGNPSLVKLLERSPLWRLAYVDHLAAIYVRTDPRWRVALDDSALRESAASVRPVAPGGLPGLGGGERERGFARWIAGFVRRETFPELPYGLGLFQHHRTRWQHAAAHFARAIEDSGGRYYEIYNNLGSSLFRSGRPAEARPCYEIVLEDRPQDERARKRLDEIDRLLGRRPPGG